LEDSGLDHMVSRSLEFEGLSQPYSELRRTSRRASAKSTCGAGALGGLVAAMNAGANLARAFAALSAILWGGRGGAGGGGGAAVVTLLGSDMTAMTRRRAVAVARSGHDSEGLSQLSVS
jgi:hypothetical protein